MWDAEEPVVYVRIGEGTTAAGSAIEQPRATR